MNSVIEYIMENYTTLIVYSIILLLAIIGRYADKTNFGQGKNNIPDENPDNGEIDENIDQTLDSEQIMQNNETTQKADNQLVQTDSVNGDFKKEINSIPMEQNNYNEFNDKFDKFEEEFNSILPKKEIIDDSLLEDIDNLSFDKTQKLDLYIPDLDDVELPRISSVETEQKKIWKK